MMHRYLLLLAVLLFGVPYAEADSIVGVDSAPVPGGLAISPGQSLSETWTQTGAYVNETVSAWLFAGYLNGQPSTIAITAYLDGLGTAVGTTLDLGTTMATLVPLFDLTMLAPGTYTLTLTAAGVAGWVWGPETGAPVTVTLADGTTVSTIAGVPLSFEVMGTGVPAVMGDGPPVTGAPVDPVSTDEPDTIVMVLAGLGLGIGMVGVVMLARSVIRSYKDAFEDEDWED